MYEIMAGTLTMYRISCAKSTTHTQARAHRPVGLLIMDYRSTARRSHPPREVTTYPASPSGGSHSFSVHLVNGRVKQQKKKPYFQHTSKPTKKCSTTNKQVGLLMGVGEVMARPRLTRLTGIFCLRPNLDGKIDDSEALFEKLNYRPAPSLPESKLWIRAHGVFL